jgi:hypothetical protein
VKMKLLLKICGGLLLLAAVPLRSQVGDTSGQSAPAHGMEDSRDDSDDRMLIPPPVSGQSYPAAPTSQERSNYVRAGLTFSTAFEDNVLGTTGSNAAPVNDVSYSVWPTLALDKTTPRLRLSLTYAPGYTFYPHTRARNEADQNALINLAYRLSPHVTLSAGDGFQKSSSVFHQPYLGAAGAVSGGIQQPNRSVIAPFASQLNNSGNVGITYQFAANKMIGAAGTFTNLRYLDPAEAPGLFDSSAQGGSAFYALRISKMHYLGVTYQYERLLSYPAPGTNQTQTHALLLFYTLRATPRFSISFFGGSQYGDIGPQFSDAVFTPSPASRNWHPAAGGSFTWQGRMTSLAASYSHMISSGGGLVGAVQRDSASASIRQQLSRTLSLLAAGGYDRNNVLTAALASSNGRTLSGTALLQQQFGQHFNVQVGYIRLHQDYSTVAALAFTPNTNRGFVSISYQFSRALGR